MIETIAGEILGIVLLLFLIIVSLLLTILVSILGIKGIKYLIKKENEDE